MVENAASVEWIVASTEVDALMLEYNLIQRHKPRFNIRYRDDKSYPYLALTVGEAMAAGAGPAGHEAQGRAVFRSVRPRVGDPRHPRRPDAGLPRADVLERVLRPARAGEAAVPVLRHRTVRRALRPRGDRHHARSRTEPTSTRWAEFLAGNARPVLRGLETEMRVASERQEFEQAAKLRDQLFAARRALESAGDGARPARGPRRGRVGRGRSRGRVPGLLRAARPGARPPRLGRRPRRGPRSPGSGRLVPRAALHGARRHPAARAGAGDAGGGRAARGVADRSPRRPGPHRGARRAAPSGAWWRSSRATPPTPSSGTSCGAHPTSAHDRARSPSSRTSSASTRRRCGSSATTSRTSARPTRSARWWCSRTACRSDRTTGSSRSRASRARTTSPRCTRCSDVGSPGCWRSRRVHRRNDAGASRTRRR